MNYILYAAVIFLASYLVGSIPWGLLIGKLYGKDVRKEGSGNIGATNVTRVVGPVQGKICFFLDFMKGFLPVLAVIILEARGFIPSHSSFRIIAMVAPVVGHMFPIFLKFKGGKGISTAAGGILALSPPACIGGLIIWAAAFLAFRYVSLASILAAIAVPVLATVFNYFNWWVLPVPVQVLLYILGLAAILRHLNNIKRLLNGTENRFGPKKS